MKKRKRLDKGIVIAIIVIVIVLIVVVALLSSRSMGVNVALIHIDDTILVSQPQGFLPYSATYSSDVVKNIERIEGDANIKAVIFEINSPGGSAVASAEIANAIKELSESKTTVALIRETGASGAYWVASSCDHIIAHPLSITGSIGVLASYLEFSGLFERYNITYQRLVSGQYKDIGSPFKELTPDERRLFQERLDIIYDAFINEVASNRNLTREQTRKLASGIFYIGKQAKELGLVDQLGDKQDAVAFIEEKHNIEAKILEFKKPKSFFEQLSGMLSLQSFWMGRGIAASMMDRNLITDLNPIIPMT